MWCVVPNLFPKLVALWQGFSIFVVGVFLTLLATYNSLSWAPLLAVVTTLLTIGGVYVAARREKRTVKVFDLRRGSLAFLIGNFGLVMSVGFLAAAWSGDQAIDFGFIGWHAAIAAGAALTAIAVFRIVDRPRYKKAGALVLIHHSPSKVAYDFEVVPGLAAALAFYGAPMWYVLSWHVVPALLGVLVWVACCGVDVLYPPKPRDQHAT